MEECKKCEGLGTIDCPECTEESYYFLFGPGCATCGGAVIMKCSECNGRGKVEKKEKT
ncbi:hypothetical protein [Caldalkalibacillus mannanilyticus]|uniref:hypothetical protein n=1 Tax=Caldalkalibacillus mannanilyticus TaxID=1418 RepID=UPI000B2CA050|nr:hypothetical protein [Caldalkalibacillus mannanilyticus]